MATCIYCRSTTQEPQFSRPEHVVPKAFGRFKNNLTIFCVCEECNQWFGDSLEVSFGRNSGEAILRLLFGVKPPSEAEEVGGHRIETLLDDDNELKGAKVYLSASDDGRLVAKSPPQVGFRVPGTNQTKWLLEEELTREAVAPYEGCPNWTLGSDESDYERVERKLQDLGLSRTETMWVRPDESNVLTQTLLRVNYQLDPEVFRVVAKIGFNYLARQNGADFVLLEDFDSFRRFVRYGEGAQEQFIKASFEPLLLDERRYGGKQTRGHLITVDWHPRHEAPVGSVKLFNDIHYRLVFAERMHCVWREVRSGHHFDIEDLTIDKLTTVRFPPF